MGTRKCKELRLFIWRTLFFVNNFRYDHIVILLLCLFFTTKPINIGGGEAKHGMLFANSLQLCNGAKCRGFFHKIFGGGDLLSGTIFSPHQGRSQMGAETRVGDGVRWGGGPWKICLLRPKMPPTAKLEQILTF